MTVRRSGWFLLVSGLLLILAAYLLLMAGEAGTAATLGMIYGVGATIAGPLLLAGANHRLTWPLAISVIAVLVVIIGGFALVLQPPPDGVETVSALGIPVRAAVVLLGIGVVPACILPWAYARAADHEALDPEALGRFVAACHAAMSDPRA